MNTIAIRRNASLKRTTSLRCDDRLQRSLKMPETRRGAAVVELALVSPIWLTVLLGICEIGQALRADAVLSAAARAAAMTASRPGAANVDVIADAKAVLTNEGISASNLTVAITVNGATIDVAQAPQFAAINVTLSIPTSNVVVVNMLTLLKTKYSVSQKMTVLRQG